MRSTGSSRRADEEDGIECLAEGLLLQDMDEDYMRAISGDQKPIQFDDDGNVYFAATEINRECDEEDETDCSITLSRWSPRIYRSDQESGDVLFERY